MTVSKRDGVFVETRKNPKTKEDLEFQNNQLIRSFTKLYKASGISQEVFERRHYEKPSVKRRKKRSRTSFEKR